MYVQYKYKVDQHKIICLLIFQLFHDIDQSLIGIGDHFARRMTFAVERCYVLQGVNKCINKTI